MARNLIGLAARNVIFFSVEILNCDEIRWSDSKVLIQFTPFVRIRHNSEMP